MLYVFPKHDLGYLHIPKTAGRTSSTSLKSVYGGAEYYRKLPGRHEPLSYCRELVGHENFNKLKLVTTIRNPYDHVVSLYFWIRRGITSKKIRDAQTERNPAVLIVYDLSFPEYIDWYCENWRSYRDWLFVDGAVPDIHFLRFEHLRSEERRVGKECRSRWGTLC